jgi:two-component system nitrogen regulation sensor histidine kinase NtrY
MTPRQRRTGLILVAVGTLVVALTGAQVLIQRLRFPMPIASNILIYGLVNVNLILLVVLILLVFRILFKIFLERPNNLLGSKFRVKLVVAFVGLALLPALLLFVVASHLITRSIEGGFNPRVEEALQRSLEIAQTYYQTSQAQAIRAARQIAAQVAGDGLLAAERSPALRRLAVEKQQEHGLTSLQVFDASGAELVQAGDRRRASDALSPASKFLAQALQGEALAVVQTGGDGDVIRGVAPIRLAEGQAPLGAVVVAAHVPAGLAAKAGEITGGIKEHRQFRMLKNPIKGMYLMLFLMVTLFVLFAAIWVGVSMARGITGPIQELAEATQAVAAGNLRVKVEARADDEVGFLVQSFNRMTADLLRSKAELTDAYVDLQRTNQELDRRRAYMETVLESVAAGVLSVDAQGLLSTINSRARAMLALDDAPCLHRPYAEVLGAESLAPLRHLVRDALAGRRELAEHQLPLRIADRLAILSVSFGALRDGEGAFGGAVLVLDDVTQLVRAQQVMAWREVARRITHEIKNPLTPIKLSTQRVRKKFAEGAADFARVFDECTRTIIQEVDGLKGLVDEFSRYARLPASEPRPGDLHAIIAATVRLYAGLPRGIKLTTDLAPDLPELYLDPEQIKRALINLVDNAVAAVGAVGEITLRTRHLPAARRVRLEVSDTGPGFPPEDRERLFLPYFSTKKSGTGLGLAIVYRVILEHGGTVRAEDNEPRGARMVIELPASGGSA